MCKIFISEAAIDGAILRFFRERMCVTQEQMANHLDISTAQYSRHESGEQLLTVVRLRKALRLVGCKMSDFCKLAIFVDSQLVINGIHIVYPDSIIEPKYTLSKKDLDVAVILANKEMLSNG